MTAALAPATVIAGLYLLALRRVRRWPAWRAAAFLAGLVVLVVAFGPLLDSRSADRLSAHMVQHLLLGLVAPPLLILGAPAELATRALHGARRRALASRVSSRPGNWVLSPAVGAAAFAAVTVGAHVPWFYDAALRHDAVHALEHALFLYAGLLLWLPLAGWLAAGRTSPLTKLITAAAAMVPMSLVAIWLMSSSTVVYDAYGRPGDVAALADQHAAGTIMLAGGNLIVGGFALAVVWAALLREERRQRRRELYAGRSGAR